MGIFLLGCGEMGRVIGTDLMERYDGELVFADRELDRANNLTKRYLERKVRTMSIDIRDKAALVAAIKESHCSVLVNAVNYYFNVDVMSACLEAGVNYLDLGGMFHTTRKQLEMNSEFKNKGLIAIPGMGSSPGITNVLAAYAAKKLSKPETIDVSFADKDYTKYDTPIVLPYTILTLFEEFGYKPVIFRNGRFETIEPLTGMEDKKFPKPLNSAKCFYTLHSEAATLAESIPGVKNCWFRGGFDPVLVDKMKFLIDVGFSAKDDIRLPGGQTVSPRDIIVKMTEKFIPTESTKINDLEFLRVEVIGKQKGKKKNIIAYCESFTNKKWNIPAGSWNTGVAPSVVAQMILEGVITEKGVVPPEIAVNPEPFFKELEKRDMKIFLAAK